jgi:hypothetical protein
LEQRASAVKASRALRAFTNYETIRSFLSRVVPPGRPYILGSSRGERLMMNKPHAIGWKAKDFALQGTDGKTYSLAEVRGPKGTLVVFICNHCPYVKASITAL